MKKMVKTTKNVCTNASWSTGCQYVCVCECCMRARKKKPLQNWPTLIATSATLVVTIEEKLVNVQIAM